MSRATFLHFSNHLMHIIINHASSLLFVHVHVFKFVPCIQFIIYVFGMPGSVLFSYYKQGKILDIDELSSWSRVFFAMYVKCYRSKFHGPITYRGRPIIHYNALYVAILSDALSKTYCISVPYTYKHIT